MSKVNPSVFLIKIGRQKFKIVLELEQLYREVQEWIKQKNFKVEQEEVKRRR